jgi:myo-inositol-1(or 4)-monophosphatase
VALQDALVATGFGYQESQRATQGAIVGALLPKVRDIRRNGSAALDLCSLAGGLVDAYYEQGVHAWDIAAGALIAREAGAMVAGLHGNEAAPELTIAASPRLFAELHDVLAALISPARRGR